MIPLTKVRILQPFLFLFCYWMMEQSGIVFYIRKSYIQPLEKAYTCTKFCTSSTQVDSRCNSYWVNWKSRYKLIFLHKIINKTVCFEHNSASLHHSTQDVQWANLRRTSGDPTWISLSLSSLLISNLLLFSQSQMRNYKSIDVLFHSFLWGVLD